MSRPACGLEQIATGNTGFDLTPVQRSTGNKSHARPHGQSMACRRTRPSRSFFRGFTTMRLPMDLGNHTTLCRLTRNYEEASSPPKTARVLNPRHMTCVQVTGEDPD
jgi:hypothetical protein